MTKKPCNKPINYKGDYLIGKPFYEFSKENYIKIDDRRIESIIDFYTPENLIITKNFYKFYAYKYFLHPGFQINEDGNTVFRMKFEKM